MKNKKQIQALMQASLMKREHAISRTHQALRMMQEKKVPINFQSVAKYAKVSKTWLYREPEIRKSINAFRDKSVIIKRSSDLHHLLDKKETQIISLNEKIKKLENTIHKLHLQLEIVYGELYKTNSLKDSL